MILELVMEPTNKSRTSENAPMEAEQTVDKGEVPDQEKKLNLLVSRLVAEADAVGKTYWKKSIKG